jgi:hypothetical protein
MSLQKKSEVHNQPFNQASIVGSKHNLALQCANPLCSKELLYLREGTLGLLELESQSDDLFRPDNGAFAMRSSPSKFFWLCGECTKTLIVKRWTASGLVLIASQPEDGWQPRQSGCSSSHHGNDPATSGSDHPVHATDGTSSP